MDHALVFSQLLRRPFGDEPAEVNDVDAIAHAHHEFHVVIYEQHRQAVVDQATQDQSEVATLCGVESRRRLIEEHQTRIHHQRPR